MNDYINPEKLSHDWPWLQFKQLIGLAHPNPMVRRQYVEELDKHLPDFGILLNYLFTHEEDHGVKLALLIKMKGIDECQQILLDAILSRALPGIVKFQAWKSLNVTGLLLMMGSGPTPETRERASKLLDEYRAEATRAKTVGIDERLNHLVDSAKSEFDEV